MEARVVYFSLDDGEAYFRFSSRRNTRKANAYSEFGLHIACTWTDPHNSVMLHAIFPSIDTLLNVMGPGSSLDDGGMIGFAVFWVATCFFLINPVPKMKPLVYAKLIVFIISAIAMLGWTVGKAGGIGPIARQGSTVHGAEKTGLALRFLTS